MIALVACFATPDYRPAVVGVAVFIAAALIYFLAYSRHRLVAQATEESNALGIHPPPPPDVFPAEPLEETTTLAPSRH